MEVVSGVLILVIAILAVILMLWIPWSLKMSDLGEYGQWVDSVSRCVQNEKYCDSGGTKTKIRRCIPHPISGRGCLINGSSKGQTYETQITKSECIPQCYKSRWIVESTSPCIDNSSDITYICKGHDRIGINDCIDYGMDNFGIHVIREYFPGSKIQRSESCESSTPNQKVRKKGTWTLVDPHTINGRFDEYINIDSVTIVSNREDYNPRDDCDAKDLLHEGTSKQLLGCRYDRSIYVPSEQVIDITAPDCEPYTPNIDISPIINCRLLPKTKYGNDLGTKEYFLNHYCYLLYKDLEEVATLSQLPSSHGLSKMRFNNNNISSTDFNAGVGTTSVVLYNSTKSMTGCSVEEIIQNSGIRIFFVPQKTGYYKILGLMYNGYRGFLFRSWDENLHWEQGKYSPSHPGKLTSEADDFIVELENVAGDDSLWKINIKSPEGIPVWIRSDKSSNIYPINMDNFYVRTYHRGEAQENPISKCNVHNNWTDIT